MAYKFIIYFQFSKSICGYMVIFNKKMDILIYFL